MSNQLYIRKISPPFENGFKVTHKKSREDEEHKEKFSRNLRDENKRNEGKNKSTPEADGADQVKTGVLKNEAIKASHDDIRKNTGMYDKDRLISIFV